MRHGGDEAPVPDADPLQDPFMPIIIIRRSEVAGTKAAEVIAVIVVLANPAAAANAISVVAGGDRSADDRGADEAGSDTPAKSGAAATTATAGLCRRAGSDAAGGGKCSKRESGNFGLDRHEKLHPA